MSFAERHEAGVMGKREQAKLAWMALALTPGMRPTRIWKAMGRLGAAERVFEASLTGLEGLGMPAAGAPFCVEGKAWAAAEGEFKRAAGARATVWSTPWVSYT